jgi:tRNA-specific 2-thiouridylase
MKKVLVAISGGVDSAIALKKMIDQGFDVSAGFMRLHEFYKEDEKKAKGIASFFNVPFFVYDFRKEFKKEIESYFIESYKKGITPNPCVKCNRDIKFKLFLKVAKGKNIATGHYVRKKDNCLYKAKDETKDQSYFLWGLSKKQIEKCFFPLGNLNKEAKKLGFDFSDESQEVCFIESKPSEFLRKKLKIKKGKILNEFGDELGVHDGTYFYTLGQRKGINLSGGPYFVYKKDFKKNVLYVSKDERKLLSKSLKYISSNWLVDNKFPFTCLAKVRYRTESARCIVYKDRVIFDKKQKAITPGQSIVFYRYGKLLGGGIIYE